MYIYIQKTYNPKMTKKKQNQKQLSNQQQKQNAQKTVQEIFLQFLVKYSTAKVGFTCKVGLKDCQGILLLFKVQS